MDHASAPQTTTSSDANVLAGDLMCLVCSYNLRGLTRNGSCPECGHAITRTIVVRQSMTKRELAVLVYRVAALWAALWMVTSFGLFVIRYFRSGLWLPLIPLVFFVAVMLILVAVWWRASWLACLTFAHDGPVCVGVVPGAKTLMWVATATIGLIYTIYGGIGTAAWVTVWLQGLGAGNDSLTSIVQATLHLIIGISLFVGADRVSRFVMWLRTVGTNKAK